MKVDTQGWANLSVKIVKSFKIIENHFIQKSFHISENLEDCFFSRLFLSATDCFSKRLFNVASKQSFKLSSKKKEILSKMYDF